jgi:hypothetical protein
VDIFKKDKAMNQATRAILTMLFSTLVLVSPAFSQTLRIMKDFSQEELVALSMKSYMAYGSNITTARIIYQGLRQNKYDPGMILSMADFFSETRAEAAAVIYYYLYNKRQDFDSELLRRFMIMFSDAMYQYGLSKHKTKEGPLTLGDIYNYEDFDFDMDSLSQNADRFIPEFGSVENFVFIMQSMVGMICGFVQKVDSKTITDYLPENIRLTTDYEKWLNSFPKKIENLMNM